MAPRKGARKPARRAPRPARAIDERPAPRVEIKGDPAFFRRVNYPAVAAGFVVAGVVTLVAGYLAQQLLIGPAAPAGVSNAVAASVTFLAMYCGGLTAGMLEPKYGVLNGPLVAVLFILVSVGVTFLFELNRVSIVGPLGLGPMRVDRVFATDIPLLVFSTMGGFTAGAIERRGLRNRAPRGADGKS